MDGPTGLDFDPWGNLYMASRWGAARIVKVHVFP
jgi:hypothetical protein